MLCIFKVSESVTFQLEKGAKVGRKEGSENKTEVGLIFTA
jgi:hypothetical protein